MARQLAPLERRGLVGRESHPDDARLAIVVLTEAGARLVGDVLPTAEEAATRVLGKALERRGAAARVRIAATRARLIPEAARPRRRQLAGGNDSAATPVREVGV